ncbi:MAG: photopigment and puc expression activator [Microbacteriaceae bacterium]|nr:photopigment and puc expression activator [Microbacteriaceae bacterium]
MLSIAYVSIATTTISDEEISALLTRSRENNQRDGITGTLLYHRGRFIQIFEGPKEIVRSRFATIASDPRHRDVRIMREKTIEARQFPEWTMGFRTLSDETVKHLEGYEDFFARSGRVRLQHSENEAQQFLEWLGEYWLAPA